MHTIATVCREARSVRPRQMHSVGCRESPPLATAAWFACRRGAAVEFGFTTRGFVLHASDTRCDTATSFGFWRKSIFRHQTACNFASTTLTVTAPEDRQVTAPH